MLRQLIVHDKQLRSCVLMCQNLWNQKIVTPNSPDLNPVDYLIWRELQQFVYRRRRIRDIELLKKSPANLLGADWPRRYQSLNTTVTQTIFVHCCNQWMAR